MRDCQMCYIEAIGNGLPVIQPDCPSGGPADLIKDGRNGDTCTNR